MSLVRKLDKESRSDLYVSLVALIEKDLVSSAPAKLSAISGVGSDIWSKSSIDEYLDSERQW